MLEIHNFWIELFPAFQNGYDFIYIFLDIGTIFTFITIAFELPSFLLLGRKGKNLL